MAALAAMVVAGTPVPASAAGTDDAAALAAEFATCTQQRGSADVLLLLDRSLSLRQSDPQMVRRDASEDLARQLAAYAESAEVDVRLQVSGFDGRFQPGAWHDLTPGSLDGVVAEINRVASNDALGPATDYWMALDGARQEFADRADGADACQFLVWFSDGQYDVDENGAFGRTLPYAPGITLNADTKEQVIAAGKESICSAKQGPMNPMRATGVFVATVGLSTSEDVDLSFLRQATDGSGGCGRAPMENRTAYLETGGAGALTLAIAAISGGQLAEGVYDGRNAELSFGLDEAVARATVLAYAGPVSGATRFGLSGPTGDVIWWEPGQSATQQVSGVDVAFDQVSEQSARFTLPRAELDGWKGAWTVHLQAAKDLPADAKAQMVVSVSGDLHPEWTNPVPEATAEEGLDLDIALTTGAGAAFTSDHPGIRLSVDYVDQDGRSTNLKSGLTAADLASPVHVSLPQVSGEGRLSLRLDLTTDTDPPTQVVPVVSAYDLLVTVAGEYPTLGTLSFPSTAGTEPSVGVIQVAGPGCVWVDADATDAGLASVPDGVDSVSVSSDALTKDSCLSVAEGETRELQVSLTPSAEANGSIVGTVELRAAPSGPGSDVTYSLAYSAQRTKLEDAATKWLTLAAITLVGLALGSIPLFLARRSLAQIKVRDTHLGPLQVARRSFRLVEGRVEGYELTPADISPATPGSADTVRRLELADVTIAPQALGNPFGVPDNHVTRTGGPVVTARSTPTDASSHQAKLGLSLTGQWIAWPTGGDSFDSVAFFSSADTIDSELPEAAHTMSEWIEAHSGALLAAQQGASAGPGAPAPAAGDNWADDAGAPDSRPRDFSASETDWGFADSGEQPDSYNWGSDVADKDWDDPPPGSGTTQW